MACLATAGASAAAGPIAEHAARAESLLLDGNSNAALAAFEDAIDVFWRASPLQVPVVALADSVQGYGDYVPRESTAFRAGDTLRVYLEPFGYGFILTGDGFRSAIALDMEIRTPEGLILAESDDFGLLTWSGRDMMREVHATVAVPLPDLKPGSYELAMDLRDQGSTKTTTVTLPFSIIE